MHLEETCHEAKIRNSQLITHVEVTLSIGSYTDVSVPVVEGNRGAEGPTGRKIRRHGVWVGSCLRPLRRSNGTGEPGGGVDTSAELARRTHRR